MTDYKRNIIHGAVCAALAIILLVMVVRDAKGAEPFKATSVVTVEYEVPDVPKLEAKAVEILRRVGTVTGETMTLVEARAITRPGGVVDVARCWEIVSMDRLRGMAQAKVIAVTVTGSHQ